MLGVWSYYIDIKCEPAYKEGTFLHTCLRFSMDGKFFVLFFPVDLLRLIQGILSKFLFVYKPPNLVLEAFRHFQTRFNVVNLDFAPSFL